ncbi:urea transporter [Nocardioides pantholopis]|uniref:urea transporter n=1 Tax=Nocardioides pantholopis TaxID=2483798 RepID=UPI000F087900|nr:urea transporter [Nocardioides pantholopis]
MSSTNASATSSPSNPATVTGASLAHGLSQIFFQKNVWTGLLILAAFVVADWQMALLVAIGTVVSTTVGYLMRAGSDNVALGMQGFNGALLGAAVFTAMGGQGWSYLATVVGAALCGPVTWFFGWLFARPALARFSLPSTTAPFCTVAGIVYAATTSLHESGSDQHFTDGTGESVLRSLLTNVSEVVLVNSVWAGGLILLGLFIASWQVGLAAAMGSVIGSLCALALGESSETIAEGLAGYSGVLTAIALAVVFLRSSTASWIYGAVGAAVTAVVTLLMNDATSFPHYTWPYILTTWVLLVVAAYVPVLRRP